MRNYQAMPFSPFLLPRFVLLLLLLLLSILYIRHKIYKPPIETCSQLTKGAGIPYSSNPILSLSSLASLPPHSSPHPSCSPPPLLSPIPSCVGQPGLTGERLPNARKVILMMMFGFEVDTLEISLREQLDWVDTVFLVEATTTTKGVGRVQNLHAGIV